MSDTALLSADAAQRVAGARVLVTGATGFIGRHLVRQALAAGLDVRTLGRTGNRAAHEHFACDLTDAAMVSDCVARAEPDLVVHLAAPGVAYGSATLERMLRVTVDGTRALLESCAAMAKPPTVVMVGSGFEYARTDKPADEDHPIVPAGSQYGAAKAAAAAVAGAFAESLPITLLRPFHVYGAGEAPQRLGPFIIAKAVSKETIEVTGSEQVRSFVHVDDFSRCIWIAANARHERAAGLSVLNVGGETPIRLRDYIEAVRDQLGARGISADVRFGALPYRAGDPMVSVPDLTRIRGLLDWSPRVSLVDGVNDLVACSVLQ